MLIFKCIPCGKLMVPLDLYLHWDTQNSHYNLQTPDYIGTALCDGYNFFSHMCEATCGERDLHKRAHGPRLAHHRVRLEA